MSEPVPFFRGTADAKGHIAFDFPRAVTGYVGKKFAGKAVEVEIRELGDKRSDLQNRGFHAMVSPWARQEGWRVDALKLVLLKTIFGTSEMTNPATGEVELVQNEIHTSTLRVRQFCELIERTMDIAAEQGHVLVAPDEYRRQKLAEQKRIARQKAKVAA